MFHMAGGTFNVTNAPNNPVKYLEPKHIGQILRAVQKSTELSTTPEKMDALKIALQAEKDTLKKRC